MRIRSSVPVMLALALFFAVLAPVTRADQYNKKTKMTFSEPVEIPGQVLPAGTYTFILLDSATSRHIVQIYDEGGKKLIATVLTINDYRIHPSGKTVVKFTERSGDNPNALKAWFHPGDNFGQEFVYPKTRAGELAASNNAPVPATPAETAPANPEELNPTTVIAVTPQKEEVPVAQAVQSEPEVAQNPTPAPAKKLPKTASDVPLVALLGFGSLGLAIALKRFGA